MRKRPLIPRLCNRPICVPRQARPVPVRICLHAAQNPIAASDAGWHITYPTHICTAPEASKTAALHRTFAGILCSYWFTPVRIGRYINIICFFSGCANDFSVYLLHKFHRVDRLVIFLQLKIQIAAFYRIILRRLRNIPDRISSLHCRAFLIQHFL